MNSVVPRWEWRTFSPDLSALECVLYSSSAGAPTTLQVSDEVYLLSTQNDANVKIRDGLLDIKQLEKTERDGLEQWRPVFKVSFPLTAETVARVFAALGLTPPALLRDAYTQDELTREVVDPERQLRALAVHKERRRYQLEGCLSELTRVEAAGRTIQTLAVESENPAALKAVVRRLGLTEVCNQSYPRGLKALVGMAEFSDDGMSGCLRCAVIDLGTNSVKFHIGERDATGGWHRVVDRAEVTRLGEGLREAGEIQAAAWERTIAAVRSMVMEAKAQGAAHVIALGTMGLRNARNSQDFIDAVRDQCGVSIEVRSLFKIN